MIDGCDEIHEDASSSDDDSLSLLRDLDACQSNGAPGDMEVGGFDSPVGNEEQQKEVKINKVKPPESGTSSCTQPAAGCPNSSSQLGKCNIKTINYYFNFFAITVLAFIVTDGFAQYQIVLFYGT